jgi:hypothetical protein
MYVITKNGVKIRLNDKDVEKAIKADAFGNLNMKDNVTVCSDSDRMKKIWIVTVELDNKFYKHHNYKGEIDNELLAEIKIDHEPTQEDLLYFQGAFGEGQNTIIRVDTGYVWETE